MTGVSADLVGAIVALGVFVIHLLTVLRAITRPNRTPASRVAWVATIMCLPVIGVVAYLFLGETSIGHERVRRLNEAEGRVGAARRRSASSSLRTRSRPMLVSPRNR